MNECCINTGRIFLFAFMTDKRIKRIKRILDNLKLNTRITSKDLREKAGYGKRSQTFSSDMIEVRKYFKAIGMDLMCLKYHGNAITYALVDPSMWKDINRIKLV